MRENLIDLKLSYEQAVHAVQSSIAYRMMRPGNDANPKHLRVGLDMSKADMLGLVALLVDKGLFTVAEYEEALRLSANHEVALHEAAASEPGMPKMTFR